jgi:hypothetical protein
MRKIKWSYVSIHYLVLLYTAAPMAVGADKKGTNSANHF